MTPETHSPASTLADRTLADIATHLPGATAVFRRHKLDFCCGGNARLAEAASARGLAQAGIVRELEALHPATIAAPDEAGTDALIDTILSRFHETHRRELPELIRLARRVEAVHKAHPEVPRGLAAALEELQQELEAHMAKEENVLFPMLRRGVPMNQPIAVMRQEHDAHGERIRALEAIVHHGQWPQDACPTWRACYGGVRKLVDDLMEHIHLENNVLFPRFDRR